MATLYITEYVDLANTYNGGMIPIPLAPSVADQTVAISGASTQSAAFQPTTRFVRIKPDANCSIKFGTNPTATTSTSHLDAGFPEYFGVPVGGLYKIAVISNT